MSAVNPLVFQQAEQDLAGPLGASGLQLALLYRDFEAFIATPGQSASSYSSPDSLLQVSNGSVVVDALPSLGLADLRTDLISLGFHELGESPYVLSGTLPIESLEAAAALPSVRAIEPAYRPITSAGAVTSQGTIAIGSDTVNNFLGLDGSGKTVGVISDSYNASGADLTSAIANDDLPGPGNSAHHLTPVNVVEDSSSGTDEGRAMLEIVHDVAPGANLAFATAGATQTQLRNSIANLASAGANIIVDDALFLTEPMFQDGIVAQEVDGLSSVGIPYFSAAGNAGRASYQQAFRNSGTDLTGTGPYTVPASLSTHFFAHNFDPTPGNTDLFQTITIPPGTTNFSFQWSDPFFSVSGGGGAATDMNIAAFDSSGNFLNIGGFTKNKGGDPVEVFSITNPNSTSMQVQIAIGKANAADPDPTLMKYVAFQPSAGGSVSIDEYATNSSTIFGHANAAGAETVGAALYSETPAYGQSPPVLETYSSRGGTPILFGPDGSLLATPETRQSPDIVAPDGVDTTFFGQADPLGSGTLEGDGYPNFFGTSAAAPHAAGVAALLLQAKPTMNSAAIYTALNSTAIDMAAPGYDNDTGWGLVNATGAIISLNAGPYAVDFTGTPGNDSMTIRRDSSGSNIQFLLGNVVKLSIPASQVASIAVNGLAGSDSLTLDSTNGAIDRSVAYNGGDGTDSFAVVGTEDLPSELDVYSDAAALPTVTVASAGSPPFSLQSVEGAVLSPTNGVVNLIGDDNDAASQADSFVVRGTGANGFTASLNASPPIQFLGVTSLNGYGKSQTDTFAVTPWASNSPAGWGVQTYYEGGSPADGDLLIYNSVAANPVSENIVVQPASLGAGEIRSTSAIDGSVVSVISYSNADLAINNNNAFGTTTDSLTLRGTNSADSFAVDLMAAGTRSSPMVDVGPLYRLRSFTGFSQLGIQGLAGNDLISLLAGRDDGSISLAVDLGLPAGGPGSSDRDQIQVYGTNDGNDQFHYTPGSDPDSGTIQVKRASASTPTRIDFENTEEVGFNGGAFLSFGSTGSDQVILDGTSGNDTFTLASTLPLAGSGQIDGGPILDFNDLGSTGSTFALNGLDGNDSFSITQSGDWGLAGVSVDGGSGSIGGNNSVAVYGSINDDQYTYTPSTMSLLVEAPTGSKAIPYSFNNIQSILIDALGQNAGDRLIVTEPVGYTPTPNSGTFPTNPPLSYRDIEYFTVDQLPTLADDTATTLEDTPVLINVLGNDTGIGDTPLTLAIANPPLNGHASIVGNQILYTPNSNYNDATAGPDVFTYQVTDANGESATALVTVHITPVNDPPVADSMAFNGVQDAPLTATLPASSGDPENIQKLTYAIVGGPSHGAITFFDPATGIFTYTPSPKFAGTDTITFQVTDDDTAGGPALTSSPGTVTLNIAGVNDPPSVFAQNLTTPEDVPVAFTLTGDDGDPEVAQSLTYAISSPPLHGTIASFDGTTGKGTYLPAANYNGPDSFTVTVTDDDTAGGPALTSGPATISITVTPVNDPPIAFAQSPSGIEDHPISITLTGDDGDPETTQTLTYGIATAPTHGQLSNFDPSTGTVTYTPDPNFAGADSFAFTVLDDATAGGPPLASLPALVNITVAKVNDPPTGMSESVSMLEGASRAIALAGDDGDPETDQALTYSIVEGPLHGQITNFNPDTGTLTYTPDTNFNGSDVFTFTVTDDNTAGGPALTSDPATVSITINAVNGPPTVNGQAVSVQGNGSTVITVTGDDGDPELNQALAFVPVVGPSHGTLTPLDAGPTLTGSAQFLYRPALGYVGADSFTFQATDDGTPARSSASANVAIMVTKPPDGIIATGAGEGGGPHVKVFNARTGVQLASFFAFEPSFTGGVRVAVGDVDGDGIPDIVAAAGAGGAPHIVVFSGKDYSVLASFYAFEPSFTGGVNVACGNVDGKPGDEIVVAAGPGAGPHVCTFQLVDGQIQQMPGPLGSFFAYEPTFTGGVNVAVGNFDGLPGDEIITGAESLGGPHVNVFRADGAILASFFAFDSPELGVTVAAGDIDGDGKAEILAGPGMGGGPVPYVFEGGTAAPLGGFAAFDPDFRGGIYVGAVDANLDGKADFLVAPGESARSVQIFDGTTKTLIREFDAYDSDFLGGVYIAGM